MNHSPPSESLVTLNVATPPTPSERAADLLAIEQAVRREIRWVYARAVVLCFCFLLLSLAAIGWAVHTTDEQNGLIAFWGGLLVGNVGVLTTLMRTYHRAIESGWI